MLDELSVYMLAMTEGLGTLEASDHYIISQVQYYVGVCHLLLDPKKSFSERTKSLQRLV